MRSIFAATCGALLFMAACGSPRDAATSRALAEAQTQEICDGLIGQGADLAFDPAVTCPGCAITDLERAADGNYDTQVAVDFAAAPLGAAGAFRLRASTPGVTHGPGFAGAFLSFPRTASGAALSLLHVSVIVKTYRDGVLQETSVPSDEHFISAVGDGTQFALRGLAATRPYDALELEYTWQNAREPLQVRVAEFCTASRQFDGALQPPQRAPAPQPALDPASGDRPVTIDVLLLYTPRFARGFGGTGGARAEAQRLLSLANAYFVNSGIAVRYALAGIEEYRGASETLTGNDILNVLLSDATVKAHRDAVAADVTALLVARTLGMSMCGIATGFNGGVQAEAADSVDAGNDGYAVVAAGPGPDQPACAENSLAHELGHVLAAGHETDGFGAVGVGAYWKPYSHAWRCGTSPDGAPQVTLENSGADPTQGTATVFSSASLIRDGEACGQEGTNGLESTQADNARAVREAAPYVAAYR